MSKSKNTFHNPRGSNTYRTRVNIPMRENIILKEAYESVGSPQPDSDSTLSHNAQITDWMRAIIRGEVKPSDVEVSEPESLDEGYWPVEVTLTRDEFAALRTANIPTTTPGSAFKRNGDIAQRIKTLLTNWCNEAVQ